MATIGDLLKIVVHAKIVPDAEPNADGEWITLSVHKHRVEPRVDYGFLSDIAPAGYHVVQVRL